MGYQPYLYSTIGSNVYQLLPTTTTTTHTATTTTATTTTTTKEKTTTKVTPVPRTSCIDYPCPGTYKVVYDPLHVTCSGSGTTPECSAKDCCELVSAPTSAPFAATTTKLPTTTSRATITTTTTTTINTTSEESSISVSMT